MSDENGQVKRPGSEPPRILPKRFYQDGRRRGARRAASRRCSTAADPYAEEESARGADTRSCRGVAAEWEAQTERIDPATMPLTRYANTILDGIVGREAEVSADIAKYAGTDLLCYRADIAGRPGGDAGRTLGSAARVGRVRISRCRWCDRGNDAGCAAARYAARAEAALADLDAFRFAAMHTMTTLMGSIMLALAVLKGRLSARDAWGAAHVDEDWQIRKWGEDAEAAARRQRRWDEMQSAELLLRLLRG